MTTNLNETTVPEADFAERVRRNQQSLGANLSAQYHFIVCGSGSSGSVVARRLAESVLELGCFDGRDAALRPRRV